MGGEFGARHCNQRGFYGIRVPQCLNRRSCSLEWGVRWAEALLYYIGVNVVQGEQEVFGVFVPHFHNGKCHWVADGEMFPIRMRKLHNIFVRQTYRLENSIRGLFGDIFCFNINVGVYNNLAKSNDCSTKTHMQVANCCCQCCDNSRCCRQRAACIFMNARYSAMLHRPRPGEPGEPAATRPTFQITLGRLVIVSYRLTCTTYMRRVRRKFLLLQSFQKACGFSRHHVPDVILNLKPGPLFGGIPNISSNRHY